MDDQRAFTLPGLESALGTGRETRIPLGVEKETVPRWLFAKRFPGSLQGVPSFLNRRVGGRG